MKDRNKLILAIVAVVAIVVIVGGATFAYWTWITADEQQTAVQFKVEVGLDAELVGGAATNITDLAPVSGCTASDHVAKLPLTLNYKNETTNGARVNATLTLSNFESPNGTPSTEDLAHLHYALTTSDASCTTDAIEGATGVFTATSGTLLNDVLIKNDITFKAPDNIGSQDYYLWIWLDKDYGHQNIGNTNSDPMQNITFTLTWSGQINNDVTITG